MNSLGKHRVYEQDTRLKYNHINIFEYLPPPPGRGSEILITHFLIASSLFLAVCLKSMCNSKKCAEVVTCQEVKNIHLFIMLTYLYGCPSTKGTLGGNIIPQIQFSTILLVTH